MLFNIRIDPLRTKHFSRSCIKNNFFALTAGTLLMGSMLEAAVVRVPQDSATIQAAITAAASGDTVLVAPGTYDEQISFLGKAIAVVSEQGPEATILDVNYRGTIVSFTRAEGTNSILSGFTLRRGSASFGAAIEASGASPTIIGNIFEDNVQIGGGFGAGIGGNSSSAIVRNNLFRRNSADSQHLSGVVAFVNSSSPLIVNNLFVDNRCRALNLTLPEGNRPCVINNTIVRNSVGIHLDTRVRTTAQIYANNIIANNLVGLEVVNANPGNDPTWARNLVFGNGFDYDGIANRTGIDGNISAPPGFACPPEDIFRLAAGSVCVDAGLNAVPRLPSVDLDGRPRIFDGDGDGTSAIDIGAFEFDPSLAIPPCLYIICPTNLAVSAPLGQTSAAVHYPSPAVTPGATLSCLPPSGSIFPAGISQVTCRTTMGMESETCSFSIYVRVTPANDDFDNALPISGSFTNLLDTVLATPAADDPLCPGGGATVWYTFAPSEETEAHINTSGSDHYASWSLFTGERGNLFPFVCDAGSYGRFRAVGGEVYYIMVSSQRGTPGGNLLLNFQANPLLRISVTVDPNASIDPRTGIITLRGAVASSRPAEIYLRCRITQTIGRSSIQGAFDTTIFTPSSQWTLSIPAINDRFRGPSASVDLFAFAFDIFALEYVDSRAAATLRLRHSRP